MDRMIQGAVKHRKWNHRIAFLHVPEQLMTVVVVENEKKKSVKMSEL